MKKTVLFILIGCLIIAFFGCTSKTEQTKTDSQQPIPPRQGKEDIASVPNAGEGWEAVKIQVVEKEGKTTDYIVKINGDFVQITNAKMKAKVEQFIPDFFMQGQKIGSRSKDLNNPAAMIVVVEEGKPEPFRGWIFSRYPDIHKGPSDKYSFRLVDFIKKTGE